MKFKEYCHLFKEINSNKRFRLLYKIECFNQLKIELFKEKDIYTDLFINNEDILKTNNIIFKDKINNKSLYIQLLFDNKINLKLDNLYDIIDNNYIYLFDDITFEYTLEDYDEYFIQIRILNKAFLLNYKKIEKLILKIIEKLDIKNIKKIVNKFNSISNRQYRDLHSFYEYGNKYIKYNNEFINYNFCITNYEQLKKINLFKTLEFSVQNITTHKKGCLCSLLYLTNKNKLIEKNK